MEANRQSNYEITKRQVQVEFCRFGMGKAALRPGVRAEDGFLRMRMAGQDYRIRRADGFTERFGVGSKIWEEADFNEVLTLCDLLTYPAPGAAAAGEYVLPQNLSLVHNVSAQAGEGSFDRLGAELDGKEEALRRALERLGGVPCGKGDVAVRLPLWEAEGLYVLFSFWSADEDFPAQAQFLCDRNLTQFMHYETVWYILGHWRERIREAVRAEEKQME